MVKIRDFKENYFFFIFILVSFILISLFINANRILPDSDPDLGNNSIQNNLSSGNNSADVKSKAPLTTNNSVEEIGNSGTDKEKGDDIAPIAEIDEDEMYYCIETDELRDKVYEVYFSKDYFHEYYHYQQLDERIFYKGKLYQRVFEEGCNWKIEEYSGIYDNFRLKFNKDHDKYRCYVLNLRKSVFHIDEEELNLCEDEFFELYDIQDGGIKG